MKNLSKELLKIILATIVVAIFTFPLKAQEDQQGRWINGVSEPWWFSDKLSKDETELVKSRWNKINSENQAKTNYWAGDYSDGGETHGSFLRWSPQNGFVHFNVNKCMAQVHDFSYGKVVLTPESIVFVPEYQSKSANSHHHAKSQSELTKWVLVKWRNVPYLVPERQIGDFGNHIAGFDNDISEDISLYYLQEINAEKSGSIDDLPIFPNVYEKYVKKPLEAQIIAIRKRIIKGHREEYMDKPNYESHTEVTINLGQADGVKKGMRFYILKSSATDALVIKQVYNKTSVGVVTRSLDDDSHKNPFLRNDLTGLPLKSGLFVTTSDYKHSELFNHDFHVRNESN